MPLKVTTWNLENSRQLISENLSATSLSRRERVRKTIESINPDILCIEEGPKGEKGIDEFCKQVLDGRWIPVMLKQENEDLGTRDDEYDITGEQWIWFLVKPELLKNCHLQSPTVWQAFTGKKKWIVHFWGEEEPVEHGHWRHPQVLIYDLGSNKKIELIGVHLKSKINEKRIEWKNGELVGEYVKEAMKNRIELATEACDVRQYIAAKFEQVEYPGILVMGDCNDGPGKDIFEDKYLFFDLISNLQGDVMVSERFFNHALFDFAGHLRWSAKYKDETVKPTIPADKNPLLLDHILISQPLCRKQLPLVAKEKAGLVEHEAYNTYNAGLKTKTSDHRPVTIKLDDTT